MPVRIMATAAFSQAKIIHLHAQAFPFPAVVPYGTTIRQYMYPKYGNMFPQ
jgi:hypothetical protein